MENLAYIYSHAAYEDPTPEPELRSLKEMGSAVRTTAQVGLVGSVIAATVLQQLPAQAVVKRGDTCSAVADVQRSLNRLGYSAGSVDSVFGSQTERAVRSFQVSRGIAVDGRVGPRTADSLGLGDASNPNSPFVVGCGGSSGGGGGGTARVVTSGSALRVRSGPGTGFNVLGTLSNGTSVGITGQVSNGWRRLTRDGWVADRYLSTGSGGGGGTTTSARVSTSGSALLVRTGPGTGFAVAQRLPNGTAVGITSRVSNGFRELSRGGWAADRYLRR